MSRSPWNGAPPNPGITHTLEQETWWYARDGMPVRVADMDPAYLVNLLAFLRRRASWLWWHRRWVDEYGAVHAPRERGLVVAPGAALAPDARERDALDWLNARPLVRALEAALRRATAVDGEVVATLGGVPLTAETVRRLADEAERGYDVERLGPRRRGLELGPARGEERGRREDET